MTGTKLGRTFAALLLATLVCPAAAQELVVGTRAAPPFVIEAPDTERGWQGISIELWEQVAEDLDLDYRYEDRRGDRGRS